MLSIWVKIFKEQKIIKNFVFNGGKKSINDFEVVLREICESLDIPTPMVLKKHIQHFKNFNQTRFKREEFIESIDFDELMLENVSSEEKK